MRELGHNPVIATMQKLKVFFILLIQIGNSSNYNSQKDQIILPLVWGILAEF